METIDIPTLRSRIREGPAWFRVVVQIETIAERDSVHGKPYFELRARDARGSLTLRAWKDTPAFDACSLLGVGDAALIEGEFFLNGTFGLDARRWTLSRLSEEEAGEFFAGGKEALERAAVAYDEIVQVVESLGDPRLRSLCHRFLNDFKARFQRAAAARANHHARRGGLIEHTRQMLRGAEALCQAYPELNRDLLLAGTLFHDAGKLWETCPPEKGFAVTQDLRGELLGHITIGIELVNALWRTLDLEAWIDCQPPSEDVRLHLLHLLAAHHGQLEFGSPVEPRTPEAVALHHLDNLDAKIEMLREAYAQSAEVAPGVYERIRALNIHPVRPLPKFSA